MKNSFKGFYNPNKDDIKKAWNSEETIFVFDTNVFLNLYSYAEQTRADFFELLKTINEKIWIPHQVGLEYQRRRLEVIRDEKGIFNKIFDSLNKIEKTLKSDLEPLALKRRFPKLHDNTEKLIGDINKSISSYKKSVTYWDDKQPCVRSHDSIRENIDLLTEGKIGPAPKSQDWLDKLYEDGQIRYENKIPPGFKDKVKEHSEERYFFYDELKYDRQYGDLILWKQLLDKASEDNIKNVIFVTDDSKEDWWYILDSRGKKQIGPHAGLKNEIYQKTNITMFQMYNTSSFLEDGNVFLDIDVHDSSIKDANTYFLEDRGGNLKRGNLSVDSDYARMLFDSLEKYNSLFRNNNDVYDQLSFDHLDESSDSSNHLKLYNKNDNYELLKKLDRDVKFLKEDRFKNREIKNLEDIIKSNKYNIFKKLSDDDSE